MVEDDDELEPTEKELLEEEQREIDLAYEKRRKMLRKRRRNKKLAASLALTIQDVEYALNRHKGNIGRAAKYLGVERPVLWRKIDSTPSLKLVLRNIKEEIKDVAEERLVEQVEAGYLPAITLYLKTQAKDRGYTEKSTVEHGLDTEGLRNAASLIQAMKRGAEQVESVDRAQLTDEIAPVIESMDYQWVEQPESSESQNPTN